MSIQGYFKQYFSLLIKNDFPKKTKTRKAKWSVKLQAIKDKQLRFTEEN